jgi:hypothetical protein
VDHPGVRGQERYSLTPSDEFVVASFPFGDRRADIVVGPRNRSHQPKQGCPWLRSSVSQRADREPQPDTSDQYLVAVQKRMYATRWHAQSI